MDLVFHKAHRGVDSLNFPLKITKKKIERIYVMGEHHRWDLFKEEIINSIKNRETGTSLAVQ